MKLLNFRNLFKATIVLIIVTGFMPMAIPSGDVSPFIFAPEIQLGLDSYVYYLVKELAYFAVTSLLYFTIKQVRAMNAVEPVNEVINTNMSATIRAANAFRFWRGKEVIDFLLFANAIPDHNLVNPVLFLWVWEVAPVLFVIFYAYRKSE